MTETAGARLTRLLALVPWLIAHDGVTVTEAADHFGVGPADLERDLWLLVVSGLPGHGPDQLVDIDFWDDGVIHVRDPQTLDRPLRLTPDEALVLLVSLRMLAQVPGVGDREPILSAAAKIESAVAEALPSSAVPTIDIQADPSVADRVDQALANGSGLSIRYTGAARDDITERVIRPQAVRAVDGLVYLEAWCGSAQALRTFRLDRIVSAEDAPVPLDVPEASPMPREVPVPACLALTPEARWVADVHDGQPVGEDDQGRLLVEVPMHSVDWAVRLVLSLHGNATAVRPPELVTAVRETARAALASYPDRVG